MNIEGALVAAYNTHPDLTGIAAFTNIPKDRPARFITVERVGGPRDIRRDQPLVAVQVWAESRWLASEWAERVAAITQALAVSHPDIARVDITSTYNNPDPASEHPRYQVNARLVTT